MAQAIQLKLIEGSLYKRGTLNKSWKERWFVLTEDLKLKYYESRSKSAESEMLGTDQHVLGAIALLDIQLIQVSSIDKSIQTTMPRYAKYVRVLPTRDTTHSYIIHLLSSSRTNTYIVSAKRYDEFKQWLAIFYKYIYAGIIFESFLSKQGRYTYKTSYTRRYFVLNEYKQMRYYNNRHRDAFHGYIDLNDIHSYDIEDVEAKDAPNNNIIQLNGQKRTWLLFCDTQMLLKKWCEEFEKLGLKSAKKVGNTFYERVSIDHVRRKQTSNLLTNEHQTFIMDMMMKTIEDVKEEEHYEEDTNKEGQETTETTTTKCAKEHPLVFKVKVDGLGIYQDMALKQEVFGLCMDALSKDMFVNGKYVTEKVVRIENGYFCSFMELQEMGVTLDHTPNKQTKWAELDM
eukprot:477448_1